MVDFTKEEMANAIIQNLGARRTPAESANMSAQIKRLQGDEPQHSEKNTSFAERFKRADFSPVKPDPNNLDTFEPKIGLHEGKLASGIDVAPGLRR